MKFFSFDAAIGTVDGKRRACPSTEDDDDNNTSG